MLLRRVAVLACALAVALVELVWLGDILGTVGWGPAAVAILLCAIPFALAAGLATANGLAGFLVRMLARDPPGFVLPGLWSDEDEVVAPTAILLTLDGEPAEPALAGLEALLAGLDASRWGEKFAAFVLSAAPPGPLAEAERIAVAAHPRIGYLHGEGGGLAGFLATREGFEFAVLLDAASLMLPEAVLRLVRILQARRDLAVVQHLAAGLPSDVPFPRLAQFGERAEARIAATGGAWWQGDAGAFRGTNAAVRLAALRGQPWLAPACGPAQAALLRAAQWGVMVWPDSRGSFIASPADIRAWEARDRRRFRALWAHRGLVFRRGLLLLGRARVAAGLAPALAPPLYVAIAALSAWLAWQGVSAPGAWVLFYAWGLTLHAPKFLGYAEWLLRPRARARYGGAARLWRSIAVETGFAVAMGAIRPVSRTIALVSGGSGAPPRPMGFASALRYLPHTVLGVVLAAGFAQAGWWAIFVAPPLAALVLAVPFAWVTTRPYVGRALVRTGIAAMPEESKSS